MRARMYFCPPHSHPSVFRQRLYYLRGLFLRVLVAAFWDNTHKALHEKAGVCVHDPFSHYQILMGNFSITLLKECVIICCCGMRTCWFLRPPSPYLLLWPSSIHSPLHSSAVRAENGEGENPNHVLLPRHHAEHTCTKCNNTTSLMAVMRCVKTLKLPGGEKERVKCW